MRLASFPRLPRTPALRWGLALAALLMTIGVAGRDVVPAWMAIQGRALISDFRHFDAMPMVRAPAASPLPRAPAALNLSLIHICPSAAAKRSARSSRP